MTVLFRINRARQPRFPIGIQDRSFELAMEHLKRLEYNGPLGLQCMSYRSHLIS